MLASSLGSPFCLWFKQTPLGMNSSHFRVESPGPSGQLLSERFEDLMRRSAVLPLCLKVAGRGRGSLDLVGEKAVARDGPTVTDSLGSC